MRTTILSILMALGIYGKGPYLGADINTTLLCTKAGDFRIGVQHEYNYGIRVGYYFGRHFGIDTAVHYYEASTSLPVDDIIYRALKGYSAYIGASFVFTEVDILPCLRVSAGAVAAITGRFENYRLTYLYQAYLGCSTGPFLELSLPCFQFVTLRMDIPINFYFRDNNTASMSTGVCAAILVYPLAFLYRSSNE